MTGPDHRLAWIDGAKGIGIVLVVVGHVLLGSPTAVGRLMADAIYAFHMPLFFVLAGLTLKRANPRDFFRRKLALLGPPYLAYLAALGLPALAYSCGMDAAQPVLGIEKCPALAVKLALGGSLPSGIFGVFWFTPCLLGGLVLAQLFFSIRGRTWRILALVALLGVAFGLPELCPWSTGILAFGAMPMAAVFVLAGYALSQTGWLNAPKVLAACLALALLTLTLGSPIDFKYARFGIPVLSIVGALGLSCLVMVFSKQVVFYPVLGPAIRWIGMNTVPVLYLHQSVHLGLRLSGVDVDFWLVALSLAVPMILQTLVNRAPSRRWWSNLSPKSPPPNGWLH